MIWRARQYEFVFPRPGLVMGIVNVTPDSFSDGGKCFEHAAAIAHGMELAAEGADIIDVGGESTRPGAAPVDEAEELRRVIPVIKELAAGSGRPVSVDTTKPAVAEAALEAGAAIVNDIGASRTDEKLWRIVAGTRAGYVAMHMLGEPRTMQASPVYADVVGEVRQFFADRLARLEKAGVSAEQVVLDVGIGFGKTVEHNLQLLAGLRSFTTMGRPVLLGVSRKSFIGKLSGTAGASRLGGSLAATVLALESGVSVFRAHDVADTVQALRTAEAILARKQK